MLDKRLEDDPNFIGPDDEGNGQTSCTDCSNLTHAVSYADSGSGAAR